MKKYLAFALALFMALALIPGIALADKGGWDGGHGGGGWGPGGGNPGGQQGSYLNQENWDGSIKVVYDTFEVSNGRNASKNGAGVTAVTLNGTAVTWQDSNTTGAASGAALSSYYTSADNRNEQSVELAITAEKGYYVSRIVVACIDPHGRSPYSCNTWSAGNAYDVPFSLAQSVKQNDGTFKLSTQLNSKNFCHSSNSNGNHGYYILIQVAPIPKPVYVEYDYGNVLTLCGDNAKLAEALNNSAWCTTVGSGNAYGTGAGNFVPNTKFEYNYSEISDIQNWKHTTNSVTTEVKAAVANWKVKFLGWEVTYYAKCTKSGNELTFSEQVGTSSNIGEGQSLNVYTHAKLVAKWEIDTTPTPTPEPGKIKIKICKAIDGVSGIRDVPENYTIKVKVGDEEKPMSIANLMEVEFEVEVGKEYTISETYKSDIPNYDFVKATIWERNIANGFKITFDEDDDGRNIIITNKYVKHGTVIKPGKLTIKKTVEGVDVPDNYEVTVNVFNADKTVDLTFKLNKANNFSHTLELEEDRYYIKEVAFTDINGYQLTGMDTQESRPYDGNGINKIFRMSVSDNSEAAITIINKYERVPEKAKLTVTKAVEGLENGVELPNDYEVTVKVGETDYVLNKENGYTQTIELGAGTYTVEETTKSGINGYNIDNTEYTGLTEGSITLAAGTKATVTITNSYTKKQPEKANISIYKAVEGVDKPENYEVVVNIKGDNFDRDITLNASNGFSGNIDVAPGKYTIAEKSSSDIQGYKLVSTTISETSVELGSKEAKRIEVTNKYEKLPAGSKLTITKSFRGVYAYDLPRSFTVYVRPMNEDGMTLGSAMAVVLNRNSDNTYSATIEVGYNVYEVTEQSPYLSGYVFTGANYSAVSTGRAVAGYDLPRTNGIYVSTGENGTASVAVTNSYYYDYHDYVPVIPPTKPLPPQTGDSGTAYMGIALCVMAAAAFVAARSRKRS